MYPRQTVTCIHDSCDSKHCPNIHNIVCVLKSCRECLTHFIIQQQMMSLIYTVSNNISTLYCNILT